MIFLSGEGVSIPLYCLDFFVYNPTIQNVFPYLSNESESFFYLKLITNYYYNIDFHI